MKDDLRIDIIRDLAALPPSRRLDDQVNEALLACADEIKRLRAANAELVETISQP